jgi:outer membrane protein insertion porin family
VLWAMALTPFAAWAQGIESAKGANVTAIEVRGNDQVEESAIRIQISQKVGQALDPELVDHDVKSIYTMGFFENVWVEQSPAADGVLLRYVVEEQPYVSDIEFTGNEHVDIEDLEAILGVREHTIFDPVKAWRDLVEVRKLYAEKGYPDASVTFTKEPVVPGDVADEGEELTLPTTANAVKVTYEVEEGSLVRIQDITLEGVDAFSHRKVSRILTTRKEWMFSWLTGAGILNEEELSTDVERLTSFYYDNGYVEVRIDEPEVVREDDGLMVTFRIEEGKQFTIGEIDFSGDVLLTYGELIEAAGYEIGGIFKPSEIREAIFGITEAYGDLGHAFAEVRPFTNVNEEDAEVAIRFDVQANDVVTVRRVNVRGNVKTKDGVIRREVRIAEGDKFSGSGLQRSKAEIRRLGFFDEVEVTSQRTDNPSEVDLNVDVTEGRTGTFSAGAGFSSQDSLLLNGRVVERNLFGRGQTLRFGADFGSVRQNFRIGFVEPYLFRKPLTLGLELFDWSLNISRFDRGGRGFSARLQYPLWELGLKDVYGLSLDYTQVGIQYRIEQSRIDGLDDFAPASVQLEKGERLVSSITPTIVRNTIDHPFTPSAGSRQIISLELAGLGGESDYTKLDIAGRWYIPLHTLKNGGKLVYSFAATLGYGFGDSGSSGEEIPLFARYFPGGINTVRGFRVRSLGPEELGCNANTDNDTENSEDCDLVEVGGSQQLIFNNEFIYPIAQEVGLNGVFFFDAGDAFTAADGIDFGDLRLAAGTGLRWLSPFGPLRIEVGWPLDPRENENSPEILFSFGAPL